VIIWFKVELLHLNIPDCYWAILAMKASEFMGTLNISASSSSESESPPAAALLWRLWLIPSTRSLIYFFGFFFFRPNASSSEESCSIYTGLKMPGIMICCYFAKISCSELAACFRPSCESSPYSSS